MAFSEGDKVRVTNFEDYAWCPGVNGIMIKGKEEGVIYRVEGVSGSRVVQLDNGYLYHVGWLAIANMENV